MNNLEWLNGKDYEPISKKELDELFLKLYDGDFNAKNKIAKSNMKLISFVINQKYYNYEDLEELFEIGMIGLTRAINAYDIKQNIAFTTYACKCINNEIIKFLDAKKRRISAISLSEPISKTNDDSMTLEETLQSDLDLSNDYEEKELYKFIYNNLDKLTEKQQNAVKIHFGFDNYQATPFKEVGIALNCSKANAAKLVENGLKKIKKELIKAKYFKEEEEVYKGYKKLY